MSPFRCGCTLDSYCSDHKSWSCHGGSQWTNTECRVCWLRRLRSVNLGPSAIPTRR